MRGLKAALPVIGVVAVVLIAAAVLFPFAQAELAKLDPGPYPNAIKAEGVVDNDAAGGSNVYIFPEIAGSVADVYVHEGDRVRAGQPLFALDDSVQRATVENLRQQALAADATLRRMRAPPRREQVAVAVAQVDQAKAALKAAADQHKRLKRSADLDARSVSKETLEGAADAVTAARAGVAVAQRQLDLLNAGASHFDIENQAAQTASLYRTYDSGKALLNKYTVRAPFDAVVTTINVPKGAYMAPVGVFDPATQYTLPAVVLTRDAGALKVRAYVDQAAIGQMGRAPRAVMLTRGSKDAIPLEFVSVEPLLTPRVQLSPADKDKGDPRVQPVIFRLKPGTKARLYPGQLVDVYILDR
ncbi:MAG TPA: biotin/lipoyl-binding protein [Caulobacteraceae bacterium]